MVTDVQSLVSIRFPIIAQRSKGTHYFPKVVGLVVISMSVDITIHIVISLSTILDHLNPGTMDIFASHNGHLSGADPVVGERMMGSEPPAWSTGTAHGVGSGENPPSKAQYL